MPWVLLGCILLVGVGFYLLIYLSGQAQMEAARTGAIPPDPAGEKAMAELLRQIRPDRIQGFGVEIVSGLGIVMLIVFAASHVGTEFGWGTLRTLLAHGAGRATFLGAKLMSIALFAAVFLCLGVAGAIIGSYVATTMAGGDTSGIDLGAIGTAAAKGYYTFLPYLALSALITLWVRSAGAGIAAGLVLYFAEGLIADILVSINRDYANIVNYGLSRNVGALMRDAATESDIPNPTALTLPDPGQAALVLAIYTVVFVGLAFWRLRTRDVTLA
jgi:ABC-2 type transport system permease protein